MQRQACSAAQRRPQADPRPAAANLGEERAVFRELNPRRDVLRQRLGGDDDRVGILRAAGHLPFPVVHGVVTAERVPQRQEVHVRFVHPRRIVGGVAAEVEAVAQRGELEVGRRPGHLRRDRQPTYRQCKDR